MSIREKLFQGFTGCSNHNCVITGPKSGMGTNGACSCLMNLNRSQQHILQTRIAAVISEFDEQDAEMERLKDRADAIGDLQYAEGAMRGFGWGQHDDTEALARCIEGRVPEAVRKLKNLRTHTEEEPDEDA